MRHFLTATVVATALGFFSQGADAASVRAVDMPGIRVASDRSGVRGQSPFAVEQAGPVVRRDAAPKIPYSIGADASDAIPAHGAVIWSDAWSDGDEPIGFYEVPTAGVSSDITLLSKSSYALSNAGMLVFNGKIMTTYAETEYSTRTVSYYILNGETFAMEDMGMLASSFHTFSMVQDPTTGICYASSRDMGKDVYQLCTFDTSTFKLKQVKAYVDPLSFNALGVTPGGELYGITFPGDLYHVDKTTGEATLIRSTGLVSEYASSGAINPRNGMFYYATCCESGSAMYEIDPSTGECAKVYDLVDNEEIMGMHFPVVSSGLAPDYARNVRFDFEGASLTGNVVFEMPTTLADGSEASGTAGYSIAFDDEVLATGNAPYGATVTDEVTVPGSGSYKVNITVSNHDGIGPKTTDNIYVGADTPLAVESVQLMYSDGVCHLTWSEAHGANGGYLEGLSYTVRRLTDGLVVAQDIAATSFSEPYAEPEEGLDVVSYQVTATASGVTSAPTVSNRVALGFVVPPYANKFTTETAAAPFTVFDANGDGTTWEWDKRGFFGCYYDIHHSAADDYLFLPAARLEEGMIYTVSFDAYGFETSRYTERVALYVGTECSPAALATCLVEPVDIVQNERRRISANFKAPADGMYYFAIRACSEPDQFVLYVDNVELSAPLATSAPSVVTGLTASPDSHGALSVTVAFTAPQTDLAGNGLTELDRVEVYNGDRLVASLSASPGEELSCIDSGAAAGSNTYDVVAYNASGEGEHAYVQAYAGFAAPMMPEWFTVEAGDNYGHVKLTWSEVTHDVNGLEFNPGDVTYIVVRYEYREQVIIAEGVAGCSFGYQACDPADEQELMQFAVFPVNNAGVDGTGLTSEMVPVGAPDGLPFRESFPGAYMSHTFGMSYDGAEWWLSTELDMQGNVPAQDGDDGFAVLGSDYLQTSARLFSGRINLADVHDVELSFHYYVLAAEDRNTVQISVNDGSGWVNAGAPFVMGNGAVHTWQKARLDLSAYAGRHIQICFEGAINTYAYIFIDNVTVGAATYPAPVALAVSGAGSGAALVWETPDLTCEPMLTLAGYNVYRDGILLNGAPVAECSYMDAEVPEGAHSYHVTAVYDGGGESEPCDAVMFDADGVEMTEAAEAAADVRVSGNSIIISASDDAAFAICDTLGRVVATGNGNASVVVDGGVYNVRVRDQVWKLTVR